MNPFGGLISLDLLRLLGVADDFRDVADIISSVDDIGTEGVSYAVLNQHPNRPDNIFNEDR